MISVKTRVLRLPAEGLRCFSVGCLQCRKSHYETLDITSNATQAEVKSAYYRLSKKYHPDTNANDPTSTEKFQAISEAYEILGNEDSRKRYDKGMAPADRMAARKPGFKVPEDPRAAFYKSRIQQKMKSPSAERIYNFDEWTKQHYSQSIRSNRILKEKTEPITNIDYRKPQRMSRRDVESKLAYTLVGVFIIVGIVQALANDNDVPKRKQ